MDIRAHKKIGFELLDNWEIFVFENLDCTDFFFQILGLTEQLAQCVMPLIQQITWDWEWTQGLLLMSLWVSIEGK